MRSCTIRLAALVFGLALMPSPPAAARSCLALPNCRDTVQRLPLTLIEVTGPDGVDPPSFLTGSPTLEFDGEGQPLQIDYVSRWLNVGGEVR